MVETWTYSFLSRLHFMGKASRHVLIANKVHLPYKVPPLSFIANRGVAAVPLHFKMTSTTNRKNVIAYESFKSYLAVVVVVF
jgi:hypothetical protein